MTELWAASVGAAALVFRTPVIDADTDTDTDTVVIDGSDGHHLARVRRLEVGETVVIADGAGCWYLTRVDAVGDGTLILGRVGETRTEPRPNLQIAVAFAPAKHDHGSEVVRQLVELGVDRIVPLVTHRSVVRWDGTRGDKAWARLTAVIREAAMQSQRARLPELDRPTTLRDVSSEPGLIVGDREGRSAIDLTRPSRGVWFVVTGPEGGFDPDEHAVLHDAERVRIGAHVLRSVTAPVAIAAALVSARAG